jgi:glyoxylase-like metal-dependent hydrolase (beta-lactamase superfamily II)
MPLEVEQIRQGLWRWTAPHPEWTPDQDWPELVGSVYYEGPRSIVLIDPLVPTDEEERFWRALDRDVERTGLPVVALRTIHWHERSLEAVASRYDAPVWREPTDGPLPEGVEPIRVESAARETLYWLPEHAALVAGDVLLSENGLRLCPESWLEDGHTLEEVRAELAPVLELPVELVLVSHGTPIVAAGHRALARALAA